MTLLFQSAIIPVLGPRAFEHKTVTDPSSPANNITTACELFVCESKRIACFQFRSPLVSGDRLNTFFDDLIAFLKEQHVHNFIILTGSFAHEQHSIGASKFVYLPDEQFKNEYQTQLKSTNWNEYDRDTNLIHGGGFAMKLFQRINQTIPSCIFFKYISEGDNRTDAVDMVQQLSVLINGLIGDAQEKSRLTVPVSWKAMFGNDPTEQLY